MSLSQLFVKVVGAILAVVGLGLVLSAVGVPFIVSVGLLGTFWSLVVGLILLVIGVWLVLGNSVTL